ncbi:MAG: FKBP-type peptidyl-prolyl cis-trans isomerase [Bacteroidales bacterium]|nr:FKBP-type peptidyl-prolyl cis-trans isomerase [Bacteroidales bacterium]
MKKINLNLLIIALITISFAACQSEFPGYKKTETGLYYKFHGEKHESKKPVDGDILTMTMTYGSKDSVIFSTDRIKEPAQIPMRAPVFQGGLFEGLALMSVGDSVTLIISADSFFTKVARAPQLPDFIDSSSYLYFDVKLLSLKTQAEYIKEQQETADSLKIQEPILLENYLKENNITVKPTEGVYYIEEEKGSGRKVKETDFIKLNFAISLIDGKSIFSTFERNRPMEFEFGKNWDTKGVNIGIKNLRKGGKAKIIVPSELGFGKKGKSNVIPPFATLIYNVELVDITTKAEHEKQQAILKKQQEQKKAKEQKVNKNAESGKIKKYLSDNSVTVQPSESGLYFIETEAGTGAQAEVGKKAKVHYTLYYLDGTKLQSSKDANRPFEFTLGKGEVIPAWDEAIALMKEGGKATLLAPSKIAYGENGKGKDIPPYTPLLFEVELLEVK